MTNLFDYILQYGDINFEEKEFNEIDNLVFCLISYLDFSDTKINDGKYTLEIIGKEYLSKNRYKDIKKLGISPNNAYVLLKQVIKKNRYKNLILSDYIYNTNKDMQFSAITFVISSKLKYICFEGTDELLSGWKEDGQLACFFPIPSQKEAIKYVNKNVKLLGPNVIIGGHSKGGNLALVSSMFMKKYKKHKVLAVYSNDGPGLRRKEFESKEYQQIKKKFIHIVPNCSMIGVLLRNDCYKVVKSCKDNIFGHSMTTWYVKDDRLVLSKLSSKSKRLENSLISWLDKHDDEERIIIVNTLFKVFEDANITTTISAKKLKNIIKIIRNISYIDKQTRDLIIDFLTYNYKNVNGYISYEKFNDIKDS